MDDFFKRLFEYDEKPKNQKEPSFTLNDFTKWLQNNSEDEPMSFQEERRRKKLKPRKKKPS